VKFLELLNKKRAAVVQPKGWSTIEQVADEMGVGTDRARKLLRIMEREGSVESQMMRTPQCQKKIYRVIKK
jgi:hypothetical protein